MSTNRDYVPFLIPLILLTVFFFLPIALMIYIAGPRSIVSAFMDVQFLSSVELTFLSATISTTVAVLVGTPVAYLLSRRIIGSSKTNLFSNLLISPLTIPHTVVGIMLLILFTPISPIHALVPGLSLVNSFVGLIAALFFVSAPIYLISMKEYFDRMEPRYEMIGMSLGASPLEAFIKIAVPNSKRGILRVALISWGRAISEFGSLLILTYFVTLAPVFEYVRPASVYVWYQYEVYGLNAVLGYSAALLLISMVVLVAMIVVSYKND
ncbi:MAG: ABC transporter permease [Thaumarchaeota archaeon]|nr:ABC transporter permease [Nitrososphaerota archaeon]